jgi:multiple sugar transport system permease protein
MTMAPASPQLILGRRPRVLASGILRALALIAYVVFLAFPLVWMLSVSLKSTAEILQGGSSLLPREATLEHFRSVFANPEIAQAIGNSLRVSILAAVASVLLAMPAAYALARFRGLLSNGVTGWVLVSQLFPFIIIVIPLFLILRALGLYNTHTGLVAVYVVWSLPFALWMLQGFVKGIPQTLEEAASVDGAGRWQIVRHIIAPLLLPGIAATALYAFILSWNEFFFALVLLRDPDLATLPVLLARYTGLEGNARWGPLAAASFVATLPSLAIFAFLQRGLTSGLLSGAVKE